MRLKVDPNFIGKSADVLVFGFFYLHFVQELKTGMELTYKSLKNLMEEPLLVIDKEDVEEDEPQLNKGEMNRSPF